MSATKILKNPPQSASDELGHVYRHGVSETRDAYQKMRCREEFGPHYEDESGESSNAQEWGKQESNGNYTGK